MSDFARDYVEVAERIPQFYEKFPDGRLSSEIVSLTDTQVVFRAYARRTPDDPCPATGHSAMSIPGKTSFTRDAEIENAETSAIGRAIVMAGIRSKKVASADEVRAKGDGNQKPQRAAPLTPAAAAGGGVPASAAPPLDLEDDEQWASVMAAVPGAPAPVQAAPDEPFRHHGPTCPDHHGREWKDTGRGVKCTAKVGEGWCKWQPSRKWLAAQEVAR